MTGSLWSVKVKFCSAPVPDLMPDLAGGLDRADAVRFSKRCEGATHTSSTRMYHVTRSRRSSLWGPLALALTFLFAAPAMAQTGTVQGTVLDVEGQPLIGANVLVVDEGTGAAVGLEGDYTLSLAPGVYVLRASYIGFESSEFPVTVRAGETVTQDFVLTALELDEVIVVTDAYRVRREASETGASSIVDGRELETLNVRSADGALQGRAAGVRITSNGGQPGAGLAVNVRGSGSITAGSEPLYIIDGVQVENSSEVSSSTRTGTSNILAGISPQDIASIEVLKDAAAASIYGAEAANGVVLITTKRGREGRTQIEFGTQIGTASRAQQLDLTNAREYLQYRFEGYRNAYRALVPGAPEADAIAFATAQTPRRVGGTVVNGEFVPEQRVRADYNGDGVVGDDEFRVVDTDWQDLTYRDALTQQYNLSARGGNERTSFFLSGRYVDDQGIVVGSGFEQYGLRINLDHRVSDAVALESRLNVVNSNTNGTVQGTNSTQGATWAGNLIAPIFSPYNVVGSPESGLAPRVVGSIFSNNPLFFQENVTNTADAAQITASAAMNAEILPGLFSRTLAGLSFVDYQESFFGDPRLPSFTANRGTSIASASRTTEFNASQALNYLTTFADVHALTTVLGVEYRRRNEDDFSASARTTPFFEFRTLSSASDAQNPTQFKTESVRGSVFGNAEYTYDNTYQVNATLRYDGSSRFGANNRYGLFGTVGTFVRLNRLLAPESRFLNDLKLRASYGVVGNSAIGDFQARQLIAGIGDGYAGSPAIRPTTLGNDLLSWEEKSEFNVGLDYGVLSNRVSGAIDVYTQDVSELLLNAPLPLDSGFGSNIQNIGTIRQQGIELGISTTNVLTPTFEWTTSFNIAFQRGEVLELINDEEELVIGGRTYKVGEAPAQLEYTPYAGVNPATGRPMYFDAEGNLTYNPSDEDEAFFGNDDPDYFGGFENRFRVGPVTLAAFVQYDFGRTTLNNDRFFSDTGLFVVNATEDLYNGRWQQPGDLAREPAPYANEFGYPDGTTPALFTSRFVEDASYLRLKLLSLTYQVSPSLFRSARIPVQNASIYVQGENLLTRTNYRGLDPELVGNGLAEYPQARTIIAGVRVGL